MNIDKLNQKNNDVVGNDFNTRLIANREESA